MKKKISVLLFLIFSLLSLEGQIIIPYQSWYYTELNINSNNVYGFKVFVNGNIFIKLDNLQETTLFINKNTNPNFFNNIGIGIKNGNNSILEITKNILYQTTINGNWKIGVFCNKSNSNCEINFSTTINNCKNDVFFNFLIKSVQIMVFVILINVIVLKNLQVRIVPKVFQI
jgi:hypothetical protein